MRKSFDWQAGRICCPKTGRCLYDRGEQVKAVFMKPGECGICGDEWLPVLHLHGGLLHPGKQTRPCQAGALLSCSDPRMV